MQTLWCVRNQNANPVMEVKHHAASLWCVGNQNANPVMEVKHHPFALWCVGNQNANPVMGVLHHPFSLWCVGNQNVNPVMEVRHHASALWGVGNQNANPVMEWDVIISAGFIPSFLALSIQWDFNIQLFNNPGENECKHSNGRGSISEENWAKALIY